jgi:hypothetical protein
MKDNFIENLEALLGKNEEETSAQAAANEIKKFFDACLAVGFNEEQAMKFVLMILGGVING